MTSMEVTESQSIALDQNNNAKKNSKNYEKYSLRPRSIQKRIETEKRAKEPKKTPKPKHKPPPLSKYRRKTANARERTRMKEINFAFDALQRVVPQYPILPVDSNGKTCEKLTKITTLRLAMKYISTLNHLLSDASGTTSSFENLSAPLPNHPIPQYHLLEDESLSPAGSSMAGSSSSEFSPSPSSSSSFTLSPCPVPVTVPQHISLPLSATPQCIQTVMRSVVIPSPTQNRNAKTTIGTTNLKGKNMIKKNDIYSGQTYSNNPSNLISVSSLSYLPSMSSPFLMSSQSSPSSSMLIKLPTPVKLNHLINQSVSSLLIGECSGGGTRTGSLSSLTESDLSEYASDLLSDEGSALDDPMFNDIIVDGEVGGTVEDLDHLLLLESDGDSLHFSSDLSDS